VPTALTADGTSLEIEINGQMFQATVTAHPLYDANGSKMRS
jgi:glycine cleavage system aminomethyltransferase T